jgi:hypothetical protein
MRATPACSRPWPRCERDHGRACRAGPRGPQARDAQLAGGLRARARPREPARHPRAPGRHAPARAPADQVRPDGRIAVRVLPRVGGGDGSRPRLDGVVGAARAAVRRRPSGQLRHVRVARPDAGLRPERLRRDHSGPIRVGCQAACRQHRDRGATSRIPKARARHRRRRGGPDLPRGDAAVRRHGTARGLVSAHGRAHPDCSDAEPGGVRCGDQARGARGREGACEGQPARARPVDGERQRDAVLREPAAVAGPRQASATSTSASCGTGRRRPTSR